MQQAPQFRVELTRNGDDSAVVAVGGELDAHTCREFKRYLYEAIEQDARSITVDLSEVTFIDSAALGVLIGGARRLAPNHGVLTIECRDNAVARVLRIVGMDRIFPVRLVD